MDTLDGMRAFAAVARDGSFTGAAKRLKWSTKLVSKYVGQLETRLGSQLFNRTTRSVSLTDLGAAYLGRVVPLLEQFDELEDVIQERQSELAGPIRLTAPTAFGAQNLILALRPFLAAHPKVTLDMHLNDQQVALVEEGFDLAIRLGRMNESTLVARRLMDMRLVTCAAPAYLAERGTPGHPKALVTHNCLVQLASLDPFNWRYRIDGEEMSIRIPATHQANSPKAVTEMAVGALGIARCPFYVVEPHLETGALTLLFEDFEEEPFGVYAVYPPNRHLTARVRALIDHLAKAFSEKDHRA